TAPAPPRAQPLSLHDALPILTAGAGRARRWGAAIEEIRPGDVISFAPGEKHWHGATPTTAMTHIAIQERLDGKTVAWMEKVSDEDRKSTRLNSSHLVISYAVF